MYLVKRLLKRTIAVGIVTLVCSLMPRIGLAEESNEINATCLACHEEKEVVGENNTIISNDFLNTTHAQFGCRTCHKNVPASHPDGKKIARVTVCADCHKDISDEYSASKHSQAAPECSSCHNPHHVKRANEISALQLNTMCKACHDYPEMTALHAKWLPQADLHLGGITCVTCHTKSDDFVLSVYISRRDVKNDKSLPSIADFDYLRQKAGTDDIRQLVDVNLDNHISIDELKTFSNKYSNKDLYLKALLTPSKTSHHFQTFDKSFNCTFCHAAGPNKSQVVKLVLPNKNGTYIQMDVEEGDTMGSMNSIPDFYMMSASRNKIINVFGLLILVGGTAMPIGHGFVRFLTRKNRKKE